MAQNIYSLQLLRNGRAYETYAAAVAGIKSASTQDGVIKLARYFDTTTTSSGETIYKSETIKTIFGIYNDAMDTQPSGYTIFDSYHEVILDLQNKIDAMGGESGSIAQQIQNAIDNLDYTGYTAADSKVVTAVSENNGVVSADGKNITEVVLTGYAEGTDADVAATDTLGQALGKLQAQINAMDKDADASNGQVVTTVAQADGKVTETKANVKDLQLGGYAKEAATVSGAVGSTDTINTAISKLENNIAALSNSTDAKIDALDATATTTASQVFDQITQTDGLVAATPKLATSLVMEGLADTADTKIAATDTLGTALAKLQGQIDSMDKAADVVAGQVVTTVVEADGKVTETKANVKDLQLGGYAKNASATGDITSTDTINEAISKLENKAAAITITNADGTINVTTGASGTDINVNVKSGEKVIKKDGNGGLYTDLDLVKITTGLPTTVKERYQLLASDDSQIGANIDIAKDSHIVSIRYISDSGDTHYQNLEYKYLDVNGTEQTEYVDISSLVLEAEFASGITVTNHVAHGVVDPASEKNSGETASFLTVGENGFKVDGIKQEIINRINELDVTDTAADGQYVSAVNETDGKVAISRANVSDAVLNGYAKGTDATAIDATDSLKAALSKLENQVDAAKAAATTKVVEGTDAGNNMTITPTTSATDNSVTYTISLTDIAKASAVGLDANGGHVTTSGNYTSGASTIAGEIAALDTALNTVSGKVDNAQAEIDRMESAIGLKEDGTYSANTTNNYTSAVTSVNGAIDALDDAAKANEDAIKTLSGNSLSGVSVNGNALTITNNVATQTVEGKQTAANATNNEAIVVETDANGNLVLGIASLDAGTY